MRIPSSLRACQRTGVNAPPPDRPRSRRAVPQFRRSTTGGAHGTLFRNGRTVTASVQPALAVGAQRNTMDDLEWLERWYAEQCDGDWEHLCGVKIDTLDNPGWLLTVDLVGTNLENRASRAVRILGDPPRGENGNIGGPIWIDCRVRDGKFTGAGDAVQLTALLATFRSWANDGEPPGDSKMAEVATKKPTQ